MLALASASVSCGKCGTVRDEACDLGCMFCALQLALAAKPSQAAPASFGTYLIEQNEDGTRCELGRGAMGVTYRALDTSLQRPVALKIVKAGFAARGEEARARFVREARAAASLRHPNVATVHQFAVDEASGQSFYAMELVEGETLEERVRRTGPRDVAFVIEIARQVTSALAAAEKRGLVHRDLKPGNIMVCNDQDGAKPVAKVIDFGLAKALTQVPDRRTLTQDGFVGTPAFASPEQLSLAPVDIRSDIYSLGATLWYLLVGRSPVGDPAGPKLPVEQLRAAHVPRRLVALLVSMLAREPVARPSVHELSEQLRTVQRTLDGHKMRAVWWAVAAALVALGTVASIRELHRGATVPILPEKSITVLPFTSFGNDTGDAYIADGVQDAILTDLTKVADLKVIGRRSAAQFRDTKQSVQEIGQALQVSYVLEGTVRKATGHIFVTVHLTDTRTGAETWSDKYERELADIFLIQSDIAQEIVSRLKSELSPREKEAIEEKPTGDMVAYDLYLRARSLLYNTTGKTAKEGAENAHKAVELLEQATARDSNFTLAYCLKVDAQLAIASAQWNLDERWKEKAKEALDAALRISPHSSEAHLARAKYLVEGLDDPAAGEKDLAIAAAGLPGRAAVFTLRASGEEQRGRWKEALRDRERAVELDPRESDPAHSLAQLLISLRRYPQAERLADHMIATLPKEASGLFWRLKSHIALARGDAKGTMIPLDASPSRQLRLIMFNQLLANSYVVQRNYSKAEEFYRSIIGPGKIPYLLPNQAKGTQLFLRGAADESLGRLARFRGETEKARGYFAAARPNFEEWLALNSGGRWGKGNASAYIAQIDAGLGRKEEAIREGRRVVDFWSTRDARVAPDTKIRLAIAYLWSGEREPALEELSEVVKKPAWTPTPPFCPGMSAGELKLNPIWDELRDDLRFQKLIAEADKPVPL